MQIHNFLCDLLVSIKLLIDNYLFPHKPGYIKSYEFNLGNRSFQLSKEPNVNYSLPAVLVSINDETINFGGRRTDLIMRNDLDNINKTPVLYNETQNIVVYLHEEQTQVFFTITFNCETQLEAKEIAYTIKRSLPLNKNLNIFSFMTYLEIDHDLLLNLLNFNIPFDNIQNLYTKLNYNTGKPEYCFSLQHNPLVRLDSVTTNISDSSQSTFQTQLELTYTIPFPQYLIIEALNLIKTINFSFNIYNHPVVMIPSTKYYLGEKSNYKIDRCLLLQSEETSFPDGIKISKTDTQVYINIQFELSDFTLDGKYLYRFYKIINNERIFFEKIPSYYYHSENKAVFIFTIEDYNTIIPESVSPMFIEFYYYLVES
jgi:hypothetical protein